MLKTAIFWLNFTLFSVKKVFHQTSNSFNTEFEPKWKCQKSCFQVRQNLYFFSNVAGLVLGWNCVRGNKITKSYQNCKIQEVWRVLEWIVNKKSFPKIIIDGKFKTNSSFHVKLRAPEKFNINFFPVVCTKYLFWEDWALFYCSMELWDILYLF